MATATAAATGSEKPHSILAKLLYRAALLATLSIWLVAVRAPLWVDEVLAYWQISGGFSKIWSRSAQMPSSFAYLYILWFAKSVLGSQEIALRIPSLLAMLAAAYCLFRAAQELFDTEIAFIVCILFCLHADVVFAATDARPYAFALLMTNLAILALIRWIKRNEMLYAILFGVTSAGILYFHYLFGAILPAFAIYYLLLRGRSITASRAQLLASLASFALVCVPLVLRFVELFRTRQVHTFAGDPNTWFVLRTLVPFKLVVIFFVTALVAALLRKVKFRGRDSSLVVLLCPLLALVPTAILYGISAATPMRVFVPRYCLVAVPGSALMWGLVISWIDSHWLRRICCVSLVAITLFQYFTSPLARQHEVNFKQAHAFVNANVANDPAPVLMCSAFIEGNFEPIPTDRASENALVSQLSYYPVDAPVILLPFSLNDETVRIGSQAVLAAAQRHQRLLAVGGPACYPTLEWLANYSRGAFTAQVLREFDREILVVEFRPVAGSD
ncbi:MAG: glycosyltransferase family 39 protein [Candidatus Sulfotelmatobacter sp.]